MKRIYLFAAVTAIALAACTKTETTGVSEGNLIKFDNAFVGNPTKAGLSEINKDNLDAFYVQGTKDAAPVFVDFEKVYKTETGQWVYDNLQEWTNATWNFGAYSDGGNPLTSSASFTEAADVRTLAITDYVLTDDNPRDLLVSHSTTDISTENKPVEFTFKHALSQVKFTLTNGVSGSDIKITELKVTGVKNTADMSYPHNGDITWSNATTTIVLNNDDTDNPMAATADKAAVSDNFAVIPVDYITEEITVTFKATIDRSEPDEDIEKNLTATIEPAATWKPGFRYNYTAEITGKLMDLIEFTLTDVEDWTDNTPDTPIGEGNISQQ